jgi:hypothetical protein
VMVAGDRRPLAGPAGRATDDRSPARHRRRDQIRMIIRALV